MAPGLLTNRDSGANGINAVHRINGHHQTLKLNPHDDLRFDPKLKPRPYSIAGTRPDSKILFRNVNILDSTGADPYLGDVYIEGQRFVHVGSVPNAKELSSDPRVRTIEGRGRTLLSGLGDAHTHFTWNDNSLELLGDVKVEEHTLISARSAQCYLDSGYTMCFGAAAAKDRLDCVIRDSINAGHIPGPRLLANAREMAVRGGELAEGITIYADGPLEMREVIRHHVALGVDQIKLSMSGEEIIGDRAATDCYFSDEETAACVDEAHRHGIRLCAHARARDSVIQCVKHGVDVIYHASYTDEEGQMLLEANRHKHVIAPAINWLYTTVYEAAAFGFPAGSPMQVAYKKELETAILALKEMRRRGVTILPGGDYGFAWSPHGTYARDLEHFVKLLDFTPMESIISATAGVAKLFMQENELGKILPGFYADCILVDGDPIMDISVLQDHDKLNVIMINGRIHKASYKEFVSAPEVVTTPEESTLTNFIAYIDALGRTRVGHLNMETSLVIPLAMASGAPYSSLYEVIELGNDVHRAGEAFPLKSVKLQAPISDRDVLCVGQNYRDHVIEFDNSGYNSQYDPSRKLNEPVCPIIFTKRGTSIVAAGEDIYLHSGFTKTLDYEGEIGVIIGKAGFKIDEKDAMDHVWGYTIINDVSAREKQRDHQQFFIGKSADTLCPMGPIAVPKENLPEVLRVQTYVNGQKRQDGTTKDLIFPIASLVKTLSQGMTLRPGDVLATGTPAGVGFGQNPQTFLGSGDKVDVTVTGLGTLSNTVASTSSTNPTVGRVSEASSIPINNLDITSGGFGLTKIGDKLINTKTIGSGSQDIIFVHGLGGSMEYYDALIQCAGLKDKYKVHLYDLEGHGLTPTKASSVCTIASYADDLEGIFRHNGIKSAILVGWSLGCLIVTTFAVKNLSMVDKLILLGPGPTPFPKPASEIFYKRAAAVRAGGMKGSGVADAVTQAATSDVTKATRPVALSAVRLSLLGTHPEGYAKGCGALAGSTDSTIELERLTMPTLILTGDADKISPPELVYKWQRKMKNAQVQVIKDIGHWHIYEDAESVSRTISAFI